ncbi:hypothetical protein WA026_000697, partial [Henosepilachna vigintioctopunctata]
KANLKENPSCFDIQYPISLNNFMILDKWLESSGKWAQSGYGLLNQHLRPYPMDVGHIITQRDGDYLL